MLHGAWLEPHSIATEPLSLITIIKWRQRAFNWGHLRVTFSKIRFTSLRKKRANKSWFTQNLENLLIQLINFTRCGMCECLHMTVQSKCNCLTLWSFYCSVLVEPERRWFSLLVIFEAVVCGGGVLQLKLLKQGHSSFELKRQEWFICEWICPRKVSTLQIKNTVQ